MNKQNQKENAIPPEDRLKYELLRLRLRNDSIIKKPNEEIVYQCIYKYKNDNDDKEKSTIRYFFYNDEGNDSVETKEEGDDNKGFSPCGDTSDTKEEEPKEKSFEYAIILCSAIDGDETLNQELIKDIYEKLAPNGLLIGFFPTIFSYLDVSHLEGLNKKEKRDALVNVEFGKFWEIDTYWRSDDGSKTKNDFNDGQGKKDEPSSPKRDDNDDNYLSGFDDDLLRRGNEKTFYSPLQLRKFFKDCNISVDGVHQELKKMEIFFLDSEHFQNENHKRNNIEDPDLPIYNHFITIKKKK